MDPFNLLLQDCIGIIIIEQAMTNNTYHKDTAYQVKLVQIHNKTFRIPIHQLRDTAQYFQTKIPKEAKKHKSRKFYTPEQLKEMESKLTCGIKNLKFEDKPNLKQEKVVPDKLIKEQNKIIHEQPQTKVIQQVIKVRPRPPLPASGPTHFIYIPLEKELADIYQNIIVPTIEEDLQPLPSLHITLLSFKLKKQEDLAQWASILQTIKDIKKKKISIKGLGMVGEKNRYARRLYLGLQGIDDIIDTLVGKGLDRGLVFEEQLTEIKYDKKTQTYKHQRPHISILKTQGKDLIDVQEYMKSLKDITGPTVSVAEFRVGVIGSYEQGKGYYNERIIKV